MIQDVLKSIFRQNEVDGFFPEWRDERTWYLLENGDDRDLSYAILSKSSYSDIGNYYYLYDRNLNFIGSVNSIQNVQYMKRTRILKRDLSPSALKINNEIREHQSSHQVT